MKIQFFKSYEVMSEAAAQIVIAAIQKKPDLLLCAATGNSPTGLYRNLKNYCSEKNEVFKHLRIIKLDEWGGLHSSHPATCEYYLQQHLIRPLAIAKNRYFGFDADAENPEAECVRVQTELAAIQPIDICVLGMGVNGHLGFNEPADQLTDRCHLAKLATTTLAHGMVSDLKSKPAFGLTLGIKDILGARHILLLVAGSGKEKATEYLLSGKISNEFPATHLWSHKKVDCLVVR